MQLQVTRRMEHRDNRQSRKITINKMTSLNKIRFSKLQKRSRKRDSLEALQTYLTKLQGFLKMVLAV